MNLPVLLAALALASGTVEAADESQNTVAVDQAISLAAQYIVGACGKDGKFVYLVNTADGKVAPDYNVVRHAGAMYALAMFNGVQPDSRAVDALKRSAGFLRKNYIRPGPVFVGSETLAVWKSPMNQPGSDVATLGATGLGLIGLLGSEAIEPESTPPGNLKALGQFLLFLQNRNGGFNSKYIARGDGTFAAWGSLYYPGEAALALVSLYESDGSEKWLDGCEAALSFLAKSRAGAKDIPADHWALIATAKLFSLRDQSRISPFRERLLAHAVQICESILADQIEGAAQEEFNGGFNSDGRTTPTSTRLEGLLAALEFLPPEQRELRSRIEGAVRRGIRFLLKSQIRTGRYAGGVPEAIPRAGASSPPEIRIDYVQHFLCALIRYRKLFDASSRAPL
jgi:hypothetical protein